MPSFNVTSLDIVAKSLGAGELGFVGSEGALVTGGAPAVTMSAADLYVDGTILASSGLAVDMNGSSYVSIGQSGSVVSTSSGAIDLGDAGYNAVRNAGLVDGAVWGIGWGVAELTNVISMTVLNSGTITGTYGIQGIANEAQSAIDNTGIVQGDLIGMVLYGFGATGNFAVTNSGTVSGRQAISLYAGSIDLINTGTLTGRWDGVSRVAVTLYDLPDKILNGGTIAGDVKLGGGADLLQGEGGRILGTVFGGGGSDSLYGSDFKDAMSGGSGDDVLEFAAGNDAYLAGNDEQVPADGNDDLDGGDGIDTYDARNVNSAVTIRLHEQRATGAEIGNDLVQFFENAFGGSAADSLVGDSGRNVLKGNGGGDALNGLEGNDRLFGNAGIDTIIGNTGRDVMTGGADNDFFDFNNVGDSQLGDSARDIVTDFTQGGDRLDLATIDASTLAGGNQAFTFIGAGAFTNVAGQLRFSNSASAQYTTVEGDVNGDGKADFSIGLFGNIIMVAGDFVL